VLDPWPFATVPNRDRAELWVGRPEALRRLDGLLASWRRRKAADISVFWADFGQGKTHALLHMLNVVASQPTVVAHYLQLPPLTTGSPFVAVYRQVLRDFPIDALAKRVFEQNPGSPVDLGRSGAPGERLVRQLLWIIGAHGPGMDVAERWLRGDKVSTSDASRVALPGSSSGIGSSPATAQDCQNVLDALLGVAIDFPADGAAELVLFVDEFQRVGELDHRKRAEVCDSLHLLMNRHPQGFHLVLAFAGGLPEIVGQVLTGDLQSRVSTRLDLHPMTVAQGKDYFVDLVNAYGHKSNPPMDPAQFPFAPDAVDLLVSLADPTGDLLSPRRINITADLLANEVLTERAGQGLSADLPITRDELLMARDRLSDVLDQTLAVVD